MSSIQLLPRVWPGIYFACANFSLATISSPIYLARSSECSSRIRLLVTDSFLSVFSLLNYCIHILAYAIKFALTNAPQGTLTFYKTQRLTRTFYIDHLAQGGLFEF